MVWGCAWGWMRRWWRCSLFPNYFGAVLLPTQCRFCMAIVYERVSVCVCVFHVPVLYRNGSTSWADFWHTSITLLSYTVIYLYMDLCTKVWTCKIWPWHIQYCRMWQTGNSPQCIVYNTWQRWTWLSTVNRLSPVDRTEHPAVYGVMVEFVWGGVSHGSIMHDVLS